MKGGSELQLSELTEVVEDRGNWEECKEKSG
jgi:hypothetical protein